MISSLICVEGLEHGRRDKISNGEWQLERKYWGGNKVSV